MSITACSASAGACAADLQLSVLPGMAALGPGEDALFAASGAFCLTRPWFEATEAAALADGSRARILSFRRGGRPVAVLPMLASKAGGLRGLTSPYTCLFAPVIDPGETRTGLEQIGHAFGCYCRDWSTVRLDALPGDAPWTEPFLIGLRRAGITAMPFDHFGNCFSPVGTLDWPGYLRARPGALRELIRRKLPRAAGTMRLDVLTQARGLEDGIAEFERVLLRSWKQPEPFPRFNGEIMRRATEMGALQLGVLSGTDGAIAVQIWVVRDGVATVLKLVHDEKAAALSPGTLLTAMMIRRCMTELAVREIDFGRGDDTYKTLWADERRQRIGLMLANPRSPAGLAAMAQHWLGRSRRTVRNWPASRSAQEDAHANSL